MMRANHKFIAVFLTSSAVIFGVLTSLQSADAARNCPNGAARTGDGKCIVIEVPQP